MKILITNIVTLNGGDAAILYAMAHILRAAFGKDTEFLVYDKHGQIPNTYYPEFTFRKLVYLTRQDSEADLTSMGRRISRLRFKVGRWATTNRVPLLDRIFLSKVERRDLWEYRNAHLIISGGGTYLVENYSLTARIFDYQLCRYMKRPLVFFTQSLGPFSNESNRQALLPILENSVAILVRDEQSLRNLIDIGVDRKKVNVAADAVFALSDPEALESAKQHVPRKGERLKIAISVREWSHFKSIPASQGMSNYKQAIRELSEHLVDVHDAEVTFVSTCQGVAEYWTDDSRVAQSIVAELPDATRKSVTVDTGFRNPLSLAKDLKQYDLVIATRMHMAILALSVGTPVVAIAYEFKTKELFQRLGAESFVLDIETISGDELVQAVDHMLKILPELRRSLFAAVQRESEDALASGMIVKRAFETWSKSGNR